MALALCLAATASAQDQPSTLFRLFLIDGRVLTAYGEWARLDDRVVFSMPTRRGDPSGDLHLVTVPAAQGSRPSWCERNALASGCLEQWQLQRRATRLTGRRTCRG